MSRVDDAVECFCSGAACSQAILAIYGADFDLPWAQAMKLASGFAGGMRQAETCGAVTGAFMVLGLKYAGPNCDKPDGRDAIYAALAQFVSQFKQRNDSIVCKELLGCDISTPAGAEKATQENRFRTICPKLVQDAAEILEEML